MYKISESDFDYAINSLMLHEDMENVLNVSKSKSISFERNPELLQRRREREKRIELKSSNGTTAEVYDQVSDLALNLLLVNSIKRMRLQKF